MKIDEKKLALLEAVLFTTNDPLPIEKLSKYVRSNKERIEEMLKFLRERYAKEDSGIMLSDIGGYRLMVKSEFLENVSDLTPHADLSRGLLRVLAIIAYHEPIKQSDIVKVIGNRTYEYVKDLVGRGLIKLEKKSRTRIITTTPQFEEYFGTKKESLKQEFKKEIEKEDKVNTEEKQP
ncbi:MAG: SMC-Scp complex subunit ScpB [Candidatus Aenigmarchaeota archaeon]|nr:SMC-Scp complex subunit ScpB [Candidatus Aenigmarchaeota archaeon]